MQDARELTFVDRHIGPSATDVAKMVSLLGAEGLDDLVAKVVPPSLRMREPLRVSAFPETASESAVLARLRAMASKNRVARSYLGLGYYGTITPPVIQRNILENPGWYTQYTPYQPEISQGRLEALLNFQTMISDLTGFPIANASLLDEGTAAAEAMALCLSGVEGTDVGSPRTFFVSKDCFPQTIAVVRTRAEALGIALQVADHREVVFAEGVFGALLQYPTASGEVPDYRACIARARAQGVAVVMAADLLSLCLLTPPGELGADIAIGSAQRFGVPMGYGGPHAAYLATHDRFKRQLPGRLVGVSKDSAGRPALRLALQTREQHIRRERATSNICTAQVLLAIMSGMYAVYHGPKGLRAIAGRVHRAAAFVAKKGREAGLSLRHDTFFDTIFFDAEASVVRAVQERAASAEINILVCPKGGISIALDETVTEEDIRDIVTVLGGRVGAGEYQAFQGPAIPAGCARTSPFLTHEVFSRYHSETEFLRYVRRLESRDLSLTGSMIPLGSCTMKLNATAEMVPVSWPQFSTLHPFVPEEQARGYRELFSELEQSLAEITGFSKVSLQPNAGSQGEYAGLLAIRAYHQSRGEQHRDVCLIPRSAHGTNPASAVMAGLSVVVVECDAEGNVDLADLARKLAANAGRVAALMVTYPSTHGVFEEGIREISSLVHAEGGQVYMDGANLNALVGLCRPADLGMDVCHINLHKTFCIPHGGGGPGMGPIGVAPHLAPFLPNHPVVSPGVETGIGPVSAAPWGSASILPISWSYMALMGEEGLTKASKVAILNANYIAKRLEPHYPVVYRGKAGFVAHECIIDLRPLKGAAGVEVEDVAKRLMDYGIHAPTVSWPVAGTMMIEPTESESLRELDRFCDAMIAIRAEVRAIEEGRMDGGNNPLKRAPHTAHDIASDQWDRPYSREVAAFPAPWCREHKFWPAVGRIDASYGDRNLVCACLPMDSYL